MTSPLWRLIGATQLTALLLFTTSAICKLTLTFVLFWQFNSDKYQPTVTMDADYAKKRLEKDLGELKRMIDDHFKQRQEDEAELSSLQDRICTGTHLGHIC